MTKYSKILFTLLLCIPFFLFSQQKNKVKDSIPALNPVQAIKNDTITIIKQLSSDSISQEYQQILEKTNNQLSLWWNPYGVMIAVLGTLFGILAIIAAVVIYRQSKEHKELINSSLLEHKIALDKLVNESKSYLKNFELGLNKSINEYNEKLNQTVNAVTQEQIKEFISKLEDQKKYIDTEIHTYIHAGWAPRDIIEIYKVDANTTFNATIILKTLAQTFVIYIRVVTTNNKKYWLGFAGNVKIEAGRDGNEYTTHQIYTTQEITIHETVFSIFKKGFPEVTALPMYIDCVRLRGSFKSEEPITFYYKIF